MTGPDPKDAGLAVVTGAASGMGEATAERLKRDGWDLLLCDLNAERLAACAARLEGAGGVATLAGDIAGAGFAGELAAALGGRRIGALVHCAGISPTMGEPARILEVNLAGSMRLLDAVRPLMAAGGAIVLFASCSAYGLAPALDDRLGRVLAPEDVPALLDVSPNPGLAYSTSKRGVLLLARRAARPFGELGVRVVSVSPGIIDTPMGRAEMEKHPIMREMVERSPLHRAARADEVASVAAFLCSADASFVTGIDILVDGGTMAGAAA